MEKVNYYGNNLFMQCRHETAKKMHAFRKCLARKTFSSNTFPV